MRAVSILCAVLIASAERPHRFDEVLRDPGSERSEATTEKKAAKPKAKATTTTEASPVENVVLADGAKAEQEEDSPWPFPLWEPRLEGLRMATIHLHEGKDPIPKGH
ncbi:unnamed protein product [Effrenium voratum]|nr:unnamed protein product [Effrenium voratum]